jgi:hypothetical protein
MKMYTIVGYYGDNSQIFVDWQEGDNAADAVRELQTDHTEADDKASLNIVAVFEGKLEESLKLDVVASLQNFF